MTGSVYSFCIARRTTPSRLEGVIAAMPEAIETMCKDRGFSLPEEITVSCHHSLDSRIGDVNVEGQMVVIGQADVYLDEDQAVKHRQSMERQDYKNVLGEIDAISNSDSSNHELLAKLQNEASELKTLTEKHH